MTVFSTHIKLEIVCKFLVCLVVGREQVGIVGIPDQTVDVVVGRCVV